jgi:hypothetical protein
MCMGTTHFRHAKGQSMKQKKHAILLVITTMCTYKVGEFIFESNPIYVHNIGYDKRGGVEGKLTIEYF